MRILVAIVLVTLLSGCREELYSSVSERDANEILATLYSAGIRASKMTQDQKAWSVHVEKDDLQRALQIARDHGLPREQFANTGEIFKKEGLVSTPAEERIRFIYAVSQELSNTLSQIDGVVSARVHPVIPANDPLASRIRPSSASVFIKHRRDADLQAMAPAIKNLVMRGIEGLDYENIALTFVAAEEPSADGKSLLEADTPIEITSVVIATLGAVLLITTGGLAYFWIRYRTAMDRPIGWLVHLRQWWLERTGHDVEMVDQPPVPVPDEAYFSTDRPGPREVT